MESTRQESEALEALTVAIRDLVRAPKCLEKAVGKPGPLGGGLEDIELFTLSRDGNHEEVWSRAATPWRRPEGQA
jgi:hypothetical protein